MSYVATRKSSQTESACIATSKCVNVAPMRRETHVARQKC